MAILNETHLAKINDALSALQEAENELALAKRAGLNPVVQGQNVSDMEAKIADLKAKLAQVKNVYFPNAS